MKITLSANIMKSSAMVSCFIFCSMAMAFAQVPTWTFDPRDYEYSMTVIAVLDFNGKVSRNANDRVVAMAGEQVRGLGSPDVYSEAMDRYLVYMQVYANQQGEKLSFKMYDQVLNAQIVAVNQPITFIIDGKLGTDQSPLQIISNHLPTNILISAATVNENAANVTIGTFTTLDPDAGDTHTYQLADGEGGADNSMFAIVGNMLKLGDKPLNYEEASSRSIRVRSTDQKNGSFEKSFTITVIDQNDVPTAIELSSNRIEENRPAGTIVGSFKTLDEDVADAHSYTFVVADGFENGSNFEIVGSQLRSKKVFDFEGRNEYKLKIRTNDGKGGEFTDDFTIAIVDINEAPTDLILANTPEVIIGSPAGTLVSLIQVVDPDLQDVHRFELAGSAEGLDNGFFKIEGNKLLTKEVIPVQPEILRIAIRVHDQGNLTISKAFIIYAIPSNRPPVAVAMSFEVLENARLGDLVGTLVATDPDGGQSLTYTMAGDAATLASVPFSLSPDGRLTVRSPGDLDIAQRDSWTFTATATDNGTPPLSVSFGVSVKLLHVPGEVLPFNNFLSPNGDGMNDLLVIEQIERYPNNMLRVYDGSGNEVLRQANYQNDWDGSYKGKPLPAGAYVLVLTTSASPVPYRASFTLVR